MLRDSILAICRSISLRGIHVAFLFYAKLLVPYLVGDLLIALDLAFSDANFFIDDGLFFDANALF